ncbi:hypothetical protein [Pseudooceanicola nanhaiensis]|jgi:hypothetical protein|uniref:Uncharacterized protein n=1 Tax=Pseudooceanicola nanhaiensis TaxID=375761 RepID=A0A917T0A5_9RHOB|nr:hypothetical protein [Pseudooceanicola nanhaiensis]GGM05719.1 hypothetical protein GCM10011534_29420 [Pseudooceanicola nanhaiensis]
MKKFILGAAMAAALAVPASAGSYSKTIYQFSNDVIIVSCFRGPWKDVIWDRPNSNFIDSLIKIGYDYPTSHAIAERVCRDDWLVGNEDGMKQEMIRIYRESPEFRKR